MLSLEILVLVRWIRFCGQSFEKYFNISRKILQIQQNICSCGLDHGFLPLPVKFSSVLYQTYQKRQLRTTTATMPISARTALVQKSLTMHGSQTLRLSGESGQQSFDSKQLVSHPKSPKPNQGPRKLCFPSAHTQSVLGEIASIMSCEVKKLCMQNMKDQYLWRQRSVCVPLRVRSDWMVPLLSGVISVC